jgi:tetratricopeptide (TPR) repeat protein
MGVVFGIMLLFGFLCNSIFKGFTFINIAYIIISLIILLYGLYLKKRAVNKAVSINANATARRALPNIVVYLAAIVLIAFISVIVPSDKQYSFSSQINKSISLINNKDYKSAQRILLKLNVQDPSNAKVCLNLAATYIMAHDPDNALKYLDTAGRMLYFNENVLFNYGLAYYQKGNYADALRCFESAISLNPSMVNAHIYAGTMCYKLRYLRKAIYHLENARFLAPGMPDILYNLGKANMELFEYGQAEKNFNQALKLNPPVEMKNSINEQLRYLGSIKGRVGQ